MAVFTQTDALAVAMAIRKKMGGLRSTQKIWFAKFRFFPSYFNRGNV